MGNLSCCNVNEIPNDTNDDDDDEDWMHAIPDDLWINILFFLTLIDYDTLGNTCHYFQTLFYSTDENGHNKMNRYFRFKCHQLCSDIPPDYKTKNWRNLYKNLRLFLITHNQIRTAQGYVSKTIDEYTTRSIPFSPCKIRTKYYITSCIPLLLACSTNSVQLFQMFLHQYPENERNYQAIIPREKGLTPLYLACEYQSVNIVKYLLSIPGIDVTHTTDEDVESTPLIIASYKGNLDIVNMLVNHASMTLNGINSRTKRNGFTALYVAHMDNFVKTRSMNAFAVMKLLVEKGADCNIKYGNGSDGHGSTSLHLAADSGSGDYDSLKLFLSSKTIGINARTPGGYTVLHLAILNGSVGSVELILNYGSGGDAIAAVAGSGGSISTTMIDVDKADYTNEETALHLACKHGKKKSVELLLAANADTELKTREYEYYRQRRRNLYNLYPQCTALLIACAKGYDEIVELLVKNGCNLFVKNHSGMNPIAVAAKEHHSKVIKVIDKALKLRNYDNDRINEYVNEKDNNGLTPYLHACNQPFRALETIEVLIDDCTVDVSIQTTNGDYGSKLLRQHNNRSGFYLKYKDLQEYVERKEQEKLSQVTLSTVHAD